jgi:uncharacterized repeat protein (TIGR01451 family)
MKSVVPFRTGRAVAVVTTLLTLVACGCALDDEPPALGQARSAITATLSIDTPTDPLPVSNADAPLTYQLDFSIADEAATAAVLTVSMDDLNGLHTPGVDDGLASDCERDYGLGVAGPMKCTRYVSALAAGGATPVKSVPADATRGAVTWTMGALPTGLYSTSITIAAARHMVPGATIQLRATLAVTSATGSTNVEALSGVLTVGQLGVIAATPTSASTVGVGAILSFSKATGSYEHDLEGHRRVVTLDPASTCAPLINQVWIADTVLPVEVNQAVITAPAVGAPLGSGAERVEYFSGRISLFPSTGVTGLRLQVPASCADGTRATIRQVDTYFEGTAQERTVTSIRHFDVSTVVCGNIWPSPTSVYGKEFHGLLDVNRHTTTDTTFNPASFRPGDIFGYRSSSTSVTVPLVDRWHVYTVPSGYALTGITPDAQPTAQAFKDCDASGLLPTDPAFDLDDPANSGWSPLDEGFAALGPYTPGGLESDPRGEAGPGCRVMVRTGALDLAEANGGHNVIVLRACTSGEGCFAADGTTSNFPVALYARYDDGNAATSDVRACTGATAPTLYRRLVSEPTPELTVASATSGFGNTANVAAGEIIRLRVMARNAARASTFPAGNVYGFDLGAVRQQVSLAGVTGAVAGAGTPAPPVSGQNVVGQTCNAAAMALIKFQPPDPLTCTTTGDLGCFAYFYDIPDACQPANGNLTSVPAMIVQVPITRTTAADSLLSFASQARGPDLVTVRGTSPTRTVTVLPQPTIGVEQSAPTTWPALSEFVASVRAENLGNTPVPGIYLVSALPSAGEGASTGTPTFGKVFVDVPAVAGDALVETSSTASCGTSPLAASWSVVPTEASSARPGYAVATVAALAGTTRCVRVRLAAGASGLPVGGALRYGVALTPGLEPDGTVFEHRAGVGASSTLQGTVNYAFTAATAAQTVVSSNLSVQVSKRVALAEVLAPGVTTWAVHYRNASALPLTNIEVVDALPTDATFVGIDGALPPGSSCAVEVAGQCADEPGPGGRQVRFLIAALASDDGAPGSGDDEAVILVQTTTPGAIAGAPITNCGQATGAAPSLTLVPAGCATTSVPTLTLVKTAVGAPATVVPGDVLTYQLVATNTGAGNTYLRVSDVLPTGVALVPGSIRIDGTPYADALVSAGTFAYDRPMALAAGGTVTIRLQVTVVPGVGAIANTGVALSCLSAVDLTTCGVPVGSSVTIPRAPQDFDGDGLLDDDDGDPLDPTACRDLDGDGCDDCAITGADGSGGAIGNDGLDTDGDGACNLGDIDDDGDGVLDGGDAQPTDPHACRDDDGDDCDDCAITGADGSGGAIGNDGLDTDGDGACNLGDADDDGDGVPDGSDDDPLDPTACRDVDHDTCDDCAVAGIAAPANDGLDTDADGACDAGDADDDGDGVPDGSDDDPLDPTACRDADDDTCDDCAVAGIAAPANDGLDTDGDGACDAGDADDDGDGVPDGDDDDPLDPAACADADADTCDDCAVSGASGGGATPASDGLDTDADGACDAGDADETATATARPTRPTTAPAWPTPTRPTPTATASATPATPPKAATTTATASPTTPTTAPAP